MNNNPSLSRASPRLLLFYDSTEGENDEEAQETAPPCSVCTDGGRRWVFEIFGQTIRHPS